MPVRISGDRENHEIWVDSLEVKKGQEYKLVWSWASSKNCMKKPAVN
ncbi:MAG: hypothetical protein PVI71_09880 [Desulfobacterales bacterium]|jgi:hypothetical protein